MPQPTLYRVQAGAKREQLSVETVWLQKGPEPLATGYKQLVALAVAGENYLVAFDSKGSGSLFRVNAKAPWIEPAAATINLGGEYDIVEPFILGDAPYLLAYETTKGLFSFIPIANDLSSQPPYKFSHPRVPLTAGFTMTQPIVVNSLVYVLCYSFTTGNVNIYSLSVTSTPQPGSPPGAPALLALPVSVHQWAKSWTRFVFFTLGGETLFFKINVGPKLNVNIDRVLDDPSLGTVEVGTRLQDQIEDPKKVDIAESFTMNGGDPYFVTYMKTGMTTWNRIHGDCQGWTREAAVVAVKDATQIVPYRLGNDNYVLFY